MKKSRLNDSSLRLPSMVPNFLYCLCITICYLFLTVCNCYSSETSLGATNSLYCNGFFYCNETPFFVPDHYIKIEDNLFVDPNEFATYSNDHSCLILGFAVHIEDPSLNLQMIANALASQLVLSEAAMFEYEQYLAGYYVIFYTMPDGTRKLLKDAGGFKMAYHNEQGTMVAGHAKLLAINLLKDSLNGDTRKPYPSNDSFFDRPRKTPYPGVFHLNPSTSLTLTSGALSRFFPREDRESITKEQAISFLIASVGGALKGLYNHCGKIPILALTGGYDSTTTLAIMLLANIRPQCCFTLMTGRSCDSSDFSVANRRCKALNLPHVWILPDNTDSIDEKLYKNVIDNILYDHPYPQFRSLISLGKTFPLKQYVYINSNVVEVWRIHNNKSKPQSFGLSPGSLREQTYLVDEKCFNYRKDALFRLEEMLSRKRPEVLSVYSTFIDVFCPYNSRRIIKVMSSIPIDFSGMQEIHQILIDRLEEFQAKAAVVKQKHQNE